MKTREQTRPHDPPGGRTAASTVVRHRILIVEDHTILRDGLRALLSSVPWLEVVADAADGLEAIAQAQRHQPDLVLMDLAMPKMTGTDAIREIRRRFAQTKIIVLTVNNSEEIFLAAIDAGADSYVLKETSYVDLLSAIRNTLAGKTYLSPGISRSVLEGYLKSKRNNTPPRTELEKLTSRERQVLKLIAEGQKGRTIAETLGISAKTVERHRSNLMEKLDLHSVSALTLFAVKKGLLS